MQTQAIQIRQRGTVTIPRELRDKYGLGAGDRLTIVDLDGAILLTPQVRVVPPITGELTRLRRSRRLSLKDLGGPTRED